MLGKTNAASDIGEDQQTVLAVNKTNGLINPGDKIWLNENAQIAGSGYDYSFNDSTATQKGMFLMRGGSKAWSNNKLFSVDADKMVLTGDYPDLTIQTYKLHYGPDNSMFVLYNNKCYRIDEKKQYSMGASSYLGENYKIEKISNIQNFVKFDLDTGDNLFHVPLLDQNANMNICIGGKIYSFSSNYKYFYTIDEETSTVSRTNVVHSGDAAAASRFYPLAVTADQKYVIGTDSEVFCVNFNRLFLAEIKDDTHIHFLNQQEMPEDLQPYYSLKDCKPIFNPYTGILTLTGENQDFLVMKYDSGTWKKIPLNFGGSYNFQTCLTVDDGLTRAMFGHSNTKIHVANLETLTGYSAMPYSVYHITENTITGIANHSAEINQEVEVKAALPQG